MTYSASNKFEAMMALKRQKEAQSPPVRRRPSSSLTMPPPRARTPVQRFCPSSFDEDTKFRAVQKQKLKTFLQASRRVSPIMAKPMAMKVTLAPDVTQSSQQSSPVTSFSMTKLESNQQQTLMSLLQVGRRIQSPAAKRRTMPMTPDVPQSSYPVTAAPKPVTAAAAAAAADDLSLLVKLVLQNARIAKEMKRMAKHDISLSNRKDPFRRLKQLAKIGRRPKFTDYLRAISEYKSMHGHFGFQDEVDLGLDGWMDELQHDLRRRDIGYSSLSPAKLERVTILKQLGLASELSEISGRNNTRTASIEVESSSQERWSQDFLQLIMGQADSDDATSIRRLQWIQQQQSEYHTTKLNCDDTFINIEANFRYQLLISCGINMTSSLRFDGFADPTFTL